MTTSTVAAVPTEIEAAAVARGLAVKRENALTAILFGGSLAVLLVLAFGFRPTGFISGILIGFIYANAYEYLVHRFLLHKRSFLAHYHDLHHSTWGTPDEPRYINFGNGAWSVLLLFSVNALPFIFIDWIFRLGFASGVLLSFTLYYVVYEEIHWRFHLGGWLPSWLQPARRHHMRHHAGEDGRFNVFLPLFDWLFGKLAR